MALFQEPALSRCRTHLRIEGRPNEQRSHLRCSCYSSPTHVLKRSLSQKARVSFDYTFKIIATVGSEIVLAQSEISMELFFRCRLSDVECRYISWLEKKLFEWNVTNNVCAFVPTVIKLFLFVELMQALVCIYLLNLQRDYRHGRSLVDGHGLCKVYESSDITY